MPSRHASGAAVSLRGSRPAESGTRASADILHDPATTRRRRAHPLRSHEPPAVRRPATPGWGMDLHPLVIVIHGGYWQAIYNLIHAGHLCVDLAAHGIASWNVEYRRIGDPRRRLPGHIRGRHGGVPPTRESLGRRYPVEIRGDGRNFGHSAGGQLALAAAPPRVASACAPSSPAAQESSTCTRPTHAATTRG